MHPRNGPNRPRFNCIGLPHNSQASGSAAVSASPVASAGSGTAVGTGLWFGVARRLTIQTLQILSEASPLQNHARRFTLQTDLIGRSVLFFDLGDMVLKLVQVVRKLPVKLMQRVGPLQLPFFDLIEFLFHSRRVSFVE